MSTPSSPTSTVATFDELSTREAIAGYLTAGWAVAPLHAVTAELRCTCGRADCSSPGKHPIARLAPNGFKDAARDEVTIRRWLNAAPWMNVMLPTGREQGFVVVDLDPAHGGMDAMGRLEDRHGHLPETLIAYTGGAGVHLYFQAPASPLRNSAGRIGPGIDVRADGGYVVAPPSRHASGGVYHWDDPAAPLLPMPGWLLARAQADAAATSARALPGGVVVRRRGSGGRWLDEVVARFSRPVGAGGRNNALTSLAGALRRYDVEEGAILGHLLRTNASYSPPLPEAEVVDLAKKICRNYQPRPLVRSVGGRA